IRDRNVTGVQTCALPIYPIVWNRVLARQLFSVVGVKAVAWMRSGVSLTLIVLSACGARPQQNPDIQVQLSLANGKDSYRGGEPRSEERRVGKEWRGWECR